MVGRQLTFFLAPSDQAQFEEALRTAGQIAILKSRSRSTAPELIDTTVISRFGEEPLRVLLARPEDVSAIRFESIKERAEHSCNPTLAPIIEFDRCFVSERLIRPGRLYYIPKYHDDVGKLVAKPAPFLKWAGKIFRYARASLREIGCDIYAGPGALKLRQAGVQLEGVS